MYHFIKIKLLVKDEESELDISASAGGDASSIGAVGGRDIPSGKGKLLLFL